MRSLRFSLALTLAALSLAPLAAGCSSSSASSTPPDADSTAVGVLEGVYVTSGAGPITQLEFVDSRHANVSWAACDSGDVCISADTYAVNAERTQLMLTEPSGKTTTLELSALESSSLTGQALHDLGGIGLTGGDGGSLTGDAGSLTTGSGTPLVSTFSVQLTSGCVQLFKNAGTFGNDQAVFDFFRSKGLSAVQAAAIVGNFDQESGDSPGSVQPGGAGRGIGQWSAGARWDTTANDNEAAYAKSQNLSTGSLQAQLGFSWYELSTYSMYGLASLQQSTTINQAVQVFSKDFEACGTCNQSQRDSYAQTAYNTFASDPVAGGDAGGDGGTCSAAAFGACTSGGTSGSCITTAACTTKGGTSTSGSCPGPANIQCCTGP